MRIDRSATLSAPPEPVWEVVSDPRRYPLLVDGVTRLEVESEQAVGLGARYWVLLRVGSAELGGLVEVVEFEPPKDMAWTSITGIDHRLRWRLRETGGHGTKLTVRLSYGAPGGLLGMVSDRIAAPSVGRHLERSLENIRRQLERDAADAAAAAAVTRTGTRPAAR